MFQIFYLPLMIVFPLKEQFTTHPKCSRQVSTRASFWLNLLSNRRTDPSPQPATTSWPSARLKWYLFAI